MTIITKECLEKQPGCKGTFTYTESEYEPSTCNNFKCALVHLHPNLKNTRLNKGDAYESKIKEDSYPQTHKAIASANYFRNLYYRIPRKKKEENITK